LYQLGEIDLGSINYLTGNCTDPSQIPLILSSWLNSIKFCLAYRMHSYRIWLHIYSHFTMHCNWIKLEGQKNICY